MFLPVCISVNILTTGEEKEEGCCLPLSTCSSYLKILNEAFQLDFFSVSLSISLSNFICRNLLILSEAHLYQCQISLELWICWEKGPLPFQAKVSFSTWFCFCINEMQKLSNISFCTLVKLELIVNSNESNWIILSSDMLNGWWQVLLYQPS